MRTKFKKVTVQAKSEEDELRRKCCSYARKQVGQLFESSNITDQSESIPKFQWSELVLGKVLGKGGFCIVHEIKAFHLADKPMMQQNVAGLIRHFSLRQAANHRSALKPLPGTSCRSSIQDDEVASGEFESREFIMRHCVRHAGATRYAVKVLSHDTIHSMPQFLQGMTDMAIEARILSSLAHPHIIKLRALPTTDMFHEGAFIVLVRMLTAKGQVGFEIIAFLIP